MLPKMGMLKMQREDRKEDSQGTQTKRMNDSASES